MSFSGNEGEQITLEQGAALTKKYRDSNPDSVKGLFIGRSHIEAVLAQNNCKGLRMYLGQSAAGEMELVIVGADGNENDLLELILDKTVRCPPTCGGTNPLNTDFKK